MEDMYVKPGNQERGWNDPPQFSYGLQKAHGPQKNLLNKRVAPPAVTGSGASPMTPPSFNPLTPPPIGAAPPPLNPAGPPPPPPPPGCVATPPPPLGPVRSKREADSSQSESEPDVEAVLSVLKKALAACRQSIKEQVCNDVGKRLCLLEDSWRAGRLSLPVRRRMDCLSHELQSGRWDSADDVHRSLMVDHVTEVSQWMVGVKRLIAETRKLSPELLKAFLSLLNWTRSAEPDQDSAEPDQEYDEPDQDSAESDQDCKGPVKDSEKPIQDPVSEP
ncbi:LOW QUALITY PROTEIN: steroid receptor RNA activator 1 [Notolabrus celidotus]|uniref:LOW QUALITY PROTEIN: steroid receptor RNA activator 1 n=1 Tax=Notolabrus celidotus TaxID=1203425 RepID=UPI00148F9BDD|nr:LOW QUALITY PROTEIN: steroid receptor RNA activator 1 [Notolabrus celidotus]